MFIRVKDEKYGLLSYLKNYLLRILITLFLATYLIYVLLLIYFWLNVLSLYTHLKKDNHRKARQISAESRVNLTEDMKAQNIVASSGSVQLIPLTLSSVEGEIGAKESGKFFILHV